VWSPSAATGVPLALRSPSLAWTAAPPPASEWRDASSVTVLHEMAHVETAADWQRAFDSELRLYHLHYLDQLCAREQPSEGFAAALLTRWIRENPAGSRPGWDPYPTSRRLVNAFKAALAGMPLPQSALASIADQCRYLVPRLELHLLGNHLLANAKALLFAGACLCGREADDWLRRGRRLLAREVREQVLADGGHIERSPMYHAIVTQDLLDLLNLRNCYALPALEYLDDACEKTLAWYATIRHPDGGIPLFNDSVQDVAPAFGTLAAYAARLGVAAPRVYTRPLTLLRDSGYARLTSSPWCLLADVGSVGPAYQPGHAHAGTLGYELSMGTERIVVDTGISTYRAGELRAQERSTAAHNTVTLDALNSSEVWGSFRVARRAHVTALVGEELPGAVRACASHDGYRRSRYRALHSRCWQLSGRAVDVEDTIDGRGAPIIETAVHLHPHCTARALDAYHIEVTAPSGARLLLSLDPALHWRLDAYHYAPAFGVRMPATVVRGGIRQPLPHSLRLRFEVAANTRP
jgi:uncharacterized heparinase superfamily protein